MNDIEIGTKLIDKCSGPCTTTGRLRHIAGGWVVDVRSPSPFLGEADLHWTACLENIQVTESDTDS